MSLALQRTRLDALAIGLMLLLCALWGVQQVASKVAMAEGLPPILQAVLRSAIAGPLLVGWVAVSRGRPGLRALLAIDASWKPGLVTSFLFAIEFMMLFPGVHLTSASHAVILLFTGGFFTAVGSHLFVPGERLRLGQWLGLALALLGVVVTMRQAAGATAGQSSLPGDALVLGAAAAWGFTTVIVKASPAMMASMPEKVLAYQLFGAAPFMAAGALLAGQAHVPAASALAWSSLLYQGVVIAFASYLTWYWLVARYPAGRLAAFSFLTPVFGVVAAAVLLGDALTLNLLLGLLLVSAGLKLVNR
jgi:drug/metabolite transporter (DMT)-like permease